MQLSSVEPVVGGLVIEPVCRVIEPVYRAQAAGAGPAGAGGVIYFREDDDCAISSVIPRSAFSFLSLQIQSFPFRSKDPARL